MAQACYIEPYLPASFRGVSFDGLEAGSEHGRRSAVGEFPFGEDTAYADLGRKNRKYRLRGRIATNDHVARTELLIAACEAPGTGVLVHPTRGILFNVSCVRLKIDDKVDQEQGVTHLDLEFQEANEVVNGIRSSLGLLGTTVAPIINLVRSVFRAKFDVSTLSLRREAQVIDTAQAMVGVIRDAYVSASAGQADVASRNRIVFDLETVIANDNYARDPELMDQALSRGMVAVSREVEGSVKYETFRGIANAAARDSSLPGDAAVVENSIYTLVRTVAAAYMAEAALESDEFRTQQILAQSAAVTSILDEEQSVARADFDNVTFLRLQEFSNEMQTELANKAFNSPGLVSFDFGGSVHPLVAAYNIYGDATRVRDVQALNTIGRLGRIGPDVLGVRNP